MDVKRVRQCTLFIEIWCSPGTQSTLSAVLAVIKRISREGSTAPTAHWLRPGPSAALGALVFRAGLVLRNVAEALPSLLSHLLLLAALVRDDAVVVAYELR